MAEEPTMNNIHNQLEAAWTRLENAANEPVLPVGHEGCSTQCEMENIHFLRADQITDVEG